MAVGTWKLYTRAKRLLAGSGGIQLSVNNFKLGLFRASASASILKISNGGISTYGSVSGEISATGGYAAGGKALAGIKWTVGASAKQMKWLYTTAGLVISGPLNNIKYAAIKNSAGKILCYCTLSTAAFSISTGNTLTITPASTGVFTLA